MGPLKNSSLQLTIVIRIVQTVQKTLPRCHHWPPKCFMNDICTRETLTVTISNCGRSHLPRSSEGSLRWLDPTATRKKDRGHCESQQGPQICPNNAGKYLHGWYAGRLPPKNGPWKYSGSLNQDTAVEMNEVLQSNAQIIGRHPESRIRRIGLSRSISSNTIRYG